MKALVILHLLAFSFSMHQSFADQQVVEIEEDCSKDLILSYFPEKIVNNVLQSYNIAQELWPAINEDLKSQDAIIVSKVEDKTKSMNPNPLRDPAQKDIAVNIFRETLYETFSDVMKKYGVDSPEQSQAMMNQIQYEKAEHFKRCMDKRREHSRIKNSQVNE
ncbi:MAG: hypothetical protein VX777_05880 [Chlamydiota bacterium]|nr:hypothetical protein [Chlamydiota bacterium]